MADSTTYGYVKWVGPLEYSASVQVHLKDDGAGNILHGSTIVGTINYTTGEVDIQDTYVVPARAPNGKVIRRYRVNGPAVGYPISSWSVVNLGFTYDSNVVSVAWGGIDQLPALPSQQFPWTPTLDLAPDHVEPLVPNSVRIEFSGKTLVQQGGNLIQDVDHATGSGLAAGTIDMTTGIATLSTVTAGAANTGTVVGLLSTIGGHPSDGVTFRTATAPIRAGSLTVQFATATGGGLTTVTAASDGTITATDVDGEVNIETGIVVLSFGRWVTAAGNESALWYRAENVVGGQIWRPAPVLSDTLRYACEAYTYIPLDAEIVGIQATRLPSDGRVPIYKKGYVVVVHHTAYHTGTYSNGEAVNLGRSRISRVRVRDAAGALVADTYYTTDLDAGTITFGTLTGLAQPLTIEDRIEDLAVLTDAQINGDITLQRPLTHDYPLGSYASSALLIGTMFARYTNLYEQSTWTGVWSDELIGSQPTSSFNDTGYPLVVTNRGTVQERWIALFSNTTQVQIIGEHTGNLGTFSIASDIAPNNPSQGVPYFTLPAPGWGSGWAAGNVLRFNTVAANYPVDVVRTVEQGPDSVASDAFTLQIRVDVNQE